MKEAEMPGTFAEVLLFVLLLLPGYVFVMMLRKKRPERRLSALEELATVGLASVTLEVIVLAAFGLFRTWDPKDWTPDVGRILEDADGYLTVHYVNVSLWAVGLLALATLAAWGAGWLVGKRPIDQSLMSSWWELFRRRHREPHVHVGCVLDDGSFIGGYLASFNRTIEETPDRDLILSKPITYRPKGDDEIHAYNADSACVSASRIKIMFVTVPDQDVATSPASPEEVEEAAVVAEPAPAAPRGPEPTPTVEASAHRPAPASLVSADGGYAWSRRSPFRIGRALRSLPAAVRAFLVRAS